MFVPFAIAINNPHSMLYRSSLPLLVVFRRRGTSDTGQKSLVTHDEASHLISYSYETFEK